MKSILLALNIGDFQLLRLCLGWRVASSKCKHVKIGEEGEMCECERSHVSYLQQLPDFSLVLLKYRSCFVCSGFFGFF